MSVIYQDVEKMLSPMKECTFMSTGMQPTLQTVYFCHDCNPAMNETFCEECAEKCHYDHHLTKSKRIKTFCFCGKKLHRVAESIVASHIKDCTFWEFDEFSKNLTGTNIAYNCKLCDKRFCTYCVFFCHYHHIDKIASSTTSDFKGCGCDNRCHKDDRILFYYLKDFSMFKLENLYKTHMVNLLLECPATSSKLFGLLIKKMKDISNDLAFGKFEWDNSLINSSSGFLRALLCISYCMRDVELNYYSALREEILTPKTIFQLCLNTSLDDKYEVRIIKKHLLFLLYKMQMLQDFNAYNKYSSKDYSNISCLQRLTLYNSVRNDEKLKSKYFDQNFSVRMTSIKLLEKYANLCRIDDHISMGIFSIMLTIVKFLMQYGVYNNMHIRMISDLLEVLLKSLKLEKTSKANEEYKELIFKKLPSLLYIMIYTYSDYIVLENLLFNYVNLREFAIGRSNFGTKIASTIFLANVRYLLKYNDSKKFDKILKLTYKSLAMLTSENDDFLKTLFNIEKHELVDFVTYYDILTDSNMNNNFCFTAFNDELFSGDVYFRKMFPNLPIRNEMIGEQLETLFQDKYDIENCYQEYFTLKKRSIIEVLKLITLKIKNFFKLIETCHHEDEKEQGNNKGAILEMIKIMEKLDKPEDYTINKKDIEVKFVKCDVQFLLNRTALHFSILKILKIAYPQSNVIKEEFFENIIKLFQFYSRDSVPNTINLLSSSYLKYFFLYLNKFPHLILKMLYRSLKFLKINQFNLSDYGYIYQTLKDSFNSKYTKIEDGEKYIQGLIYNLKSLKLIKDYLPSQLLADMRSRIIEFLERLNDNDKGIKEFFWVNNYKSRLLMKDEEYDNLIHFEEYLNELDVQRNLPREEKIKKFGASAEAQRKKLMREMKKKGKEQNNPKLKNKLQSSNMGGNYDSNISGERVGYEGNDPYKNMDEPSFVNDLTIDNSNIIRKEKHDNFSNDLIDSRLDGENRLNVDKSLNNSVISEDQFMLENVKNMPEKRDLPVIDDKDFDNSMIKIDDHLHQEISENIRILEKAEEKGILEPGIREIHDEDDEFDLEEKNLLANINKDENGDLIYTRLKDDENYINQIVLTEEYVVEEIEIMGDINSVSPELYQNKKLRERNIVKNRRELANIRRLKGEERKQKLLDKLMSSKHTARAFVNLLGVINSFAEDFTSEEFQEILRRYFPRNEIINILQKKRYLRDLKLRSQIIKMLKINYLSSPISKDKSYFDLFYLNEYDFFVKLYERNAGKKSINKMSNISKVANILINELSNLEEILTPFYDSKKYDEAHLKKNIKAINIYITDGLLSTIKQFADKIYSHGNNITGEELCLSYKVIFHYNEVKFVIDNIVQGKNLKEALIISKQKRDEEDNEFYEIYDKKKGGVDNFTRFNMFKLLYKIINESLQNALPKYRKNVSDVLSSLSKRINNIGAYDGIDFLPSMLDKVNPTLMGKSKDIFIVNQYTKIVRFYIEQSKNFRSSPVLACFNCIIHEGDFNYRDMFTRFFVLTFTIEKLRDHQENYLLEIMNRSIEFDHEKLHPVIYKYLLEEEKNNKERLFNELNRHMLYNMIILFVYVNRNDAFHIWQEANYYSCQLVKFFQLLAKNPTTYLHDYILKHSHAQGKYMHYNFFILLEALMNKVVKLSKWGRDYDLKNEIFFDNMYVIFHIILNCFSDYAREADAEGVYLVFMRLKTLIFGFKKIMYYETTELNDITFEIKLSILNLLNCLLDEGKAHNIVSEIAFYFDPFKMFKLIVFLFRLLIQNLLKTPGVVLSIDKQEDPHKILLTLKTNLPQLLRLYQKDEKFNTSPLLSLCYKIFFYMCTLKNIYKDPYAIKCFYAIKRFKNSMKGPKINNSQKKMSTTDYKYLQETGTLVDTFLEIDEITESEFVIYKFIKQSIGVIEIFSYRNRLEQVYFPRIPLTYYLHNESLQIFFDNFYNRELSAIKSYSLNILIHQLVEECFYSYHLDRISNFIGLLDKASSFSLYKIIVCIINVFICCLYWIYIDTKNKIFSRLAFAFDIINLLYMIGLITLWLLLRFYPKYQQSLYLFAQHNKKSVSTELGIKSMLKVLIWDIFINDFDFLYLSSTCIFCIFSIIYQNASLKFFQLMNFVILSSNLFRLMKFIGRHWIQVFILALMLLILLGVTVALTHDYFNMFPVKDPNGNADTFFCKDNFSKCMFYLLFYGLRYDSGVTEVIKSEFTKDELYTNDAGNYFKRLIVDLGFHIFIKGMWLTLMSATFILTYFELRKSREIVEFDTTNNCFICHLSRDVFHKYKIDFDKHVKKEHKILYYIYFIMYIVTKNPQNLTKLEKHVLNKFRIDDLYWIPSLDTISLQEKITKIREQKTFITTKYN